MNRIPVGRTISSAYAFTFGHIGTVIGLIWLPLLLYYVGQFFIVNYAESLAASGDPTAAGRATLVVIGFWFLSVFFTAIIGVALTRQALTPKPGNIIVSFGFGPAELNYFLALLTVFAVMLAVYIGVVFVAAAVGGVGAIAAGAAGARAPWLQSSIMATVMVLAAAALIYVGVRLVYLVAPVTVSESKIDLIRSWQVSRGNFWRMLLVFAATVGPVAVLSQVAFALIVGPEYMKALAMMTLGIFHAVAGGDTPPTQLFQHLPDISSKRPFLLGLGFLLAPFAYGLMFSSSAYAYRALVGTPPLSQPPDVGPFKAA